MATAFVRRKATALCASEGDGFGGVGGDGFSVRRKVTAFVASDGNGFVCVGWRRL
jgi:hypothetical protein